MTDYEKVVAVFEETGVDFSSYQQSDQGGVIELTDPNDTILANIFFDINGKFIGSESGPEES